MRSLLHFLASALAAAAALALGNALTRLLAFLYPASSVGLLLTVAVSGSALGALLAHRLGWLPGRSAPLAASGAAAGAGFATLALASLTLGAALNSAVLNVLLATAAFAAIGLSAAGAILIRPASASSAFAAQAGGAGVAAALGPLLLDLAGPVTLGLLAAVALAFAGAAHAAGWWLARQGADGDEDQADDEGGSWRRTTLRVAAGLSALGALLALCAAPLHLATGLLSPNVPSVASEKSLFASVRDATLSERVVATTWDAYARTDVTEPANDADIKWAYLDGGVAGVIHKGVGSGLPESLRSDIGNLPFVLPGSHQKVLVIGAATGEEVALALAGGAQEVVAAEVSPGLLRATARYSSFAGDVLKQPRVRVVSGDGRAFLRASGEQFDVIYLTLGTAPVAQFGGALSGSELYTIDAFADYLDHLRQDGRLVLKLRDEQEFTRAFNTAFQVLTRRGAAPLEAIRRLLAINNQPIAERSGGGIVLPLLMVRKTPYLEDEARSTFEALRQTPYPPIFVPHLEQLSPFGAFADEGLGPEIFEDKAPYDIHPATDASPFFFEFGKGPPWIVLLAPFALAGLFGLAVLVLRRPSTESDDVVAAQSDEAVAFVEDEVPWRFVGFCAAVGAGGAAAGTALLYRLPLLVGQPTLTPALTLGSLLLGASVGSLLAGRVAPALLRPAIGWAGLLGGVLSIALVELLPLATSAFRSQPLAGRALVAAVVLVPLGVALGVPFPSAVRLLSAAGRGRWAALLWAISALAAGAGSVLAVALGITAGFGVPLGLAAVCLFAAFMVAGLKLLVAGPEVAPAAPLPAVDTSQFQRPAPGEA